MITISIKLDEINYPIGISNKYLLQQQLLNKSELFDYLKMAIAELQKNTDNEIFEIKLNELRRLLNDSKRQ